MASISDEEVYTDETVISRLSKQYIGYTLGELSEVKLSAVKFDKKVRDYLKCRRGQTKPCDKVRMPNKGSADIAAKAIFRKRSKSEAVVRLLESYKCDKCGFWHLTNKNRK